MRTIPTVIPFLLITIVDITSCLWMDSSGPVLSIVQPIFFPSYVSNIKKIGLRALDVKANSTLHLRCSGSSPMIWGFPQNYWYEEDSILNLAKISNNCYLKPPSNVQKCTSDFILTDISYEQTGLFSCHYNHTSLDSAPSGSSGSKPLSVMHYDSNEDIDIKQSVYIFINDPKYLLVPYEGREVIFISVVQSHPATIPCLPTNSRADISLWKVHTRSGKPEMIQVGDDYGVTYDPTVGFYFEHPQWDAESTYLECRASLGSENETTAVNIHWSIPPVSLHPVIRDDEAKPVYVNSTFSLTCNVRTEVGVIIASMIWRHPVMRDEGNRLKIGEGKTTKGGDGGNIYEINSKKLTVFMAEKSDEGLYECIVTAATGKSYSVSHSVKIYDNDLPSFINLTSEFYRSEETALKINNGETVQFVVNVISFPDINSVTLVWYKDGIKIVEVNNRKSALFSQSATPTDVTESDKSTPADHIYSRSGSSDDNQHDANEPHYLAGIEGTQAILKIKKVNLKDSGIYTLVGSTLDNKSSSNVSMILHVMGKPDVEITGGHTFYRKNSNITLSCLVSGYPQPRIWWRWFSCMTPNDTKPDARCSNNPNNGLSYYDWTDVEEVDTANHEIIIYGENNLVNLTLMTNNSGIYSCWSQNDNGTTISQARIFISDASDGFEFNLITEEAVVNETMSFECLASIYRFPNMTGLEIFFSDGNGTSETFANQTEGILMVDSFAHDTFRKDIVVYPVKFSNTGSYYCNVTYGDHLSRNKNIHPVEENYLRLDIEVESSIPPEITKSNMNGIKIEKQATQSLDLFCHSSGRPKPKISWLKNGEKVTGDGIDIMDSGQKLIISRLAASDSGKYECIVENSINHEPVRRIQYLKVLGEDDQVKPASVVMASIFIVVIIIFVLMAIFMGKKIREERRQKQELEFFSANLFDQGQLDLFNPDMPLDEQVDLLPYDKRWEFPRDRLKLGKTLGQGAFGRVVKAEAIGLDDDEPSTTVAVKMLKERADVNQKKALMAELKILIHLGRHLNIVNLLAACTSSLAKGELLVIVEYCPFGNLREFLLAHRKTFVNQIDPVTGKIDNNIQTVSNNSQYDNPSYVSGYNNSSTYSNGSNGQIKLGINGVGVSNPVYQSNSIQYAKFLNNQNRQNSDHSYQNQLIPMADKNGGTTTDGSDDLDSTAYTYSSDQIIPYKSSVSKKSSENQRLVTTCDLICYAFQVARGMEYLASRKLIHRDLAARNVLLAEENVVKICDFGLAKDCYKYDEYVKKGDGPLPIKWMAIESIRDKVFTTKSDVWSFAVLNWEFFTLGGNPYPGLEVDEEFYRKLKNGYRMEKPDLCPTIIYDIMTRCWDADDSKRPDFRELSEILGDLLESSVKQHYVDLNEPYQEMNQILFSANDYLNMRRLSQVSHNDANYVNETTEIYLDMDQQQTTQRVDCDTSHYNDIPKNIQTKMMVSRDNRRSEPMDHVAMSHFDSGVSSPASDNFSTNSRSDQKYYSPDVNYNR